MPQIFLRSVILAKSWDHWTAWDMSEEFWSHREYCSDQTIFFFSLCLNFIQIAVTLQDLMERDVPYGVFPHALSSAMRQSSRLQSCKWQLAMFVYYVANILGRCLAWVPFAIFFGFKGFLYVFLFAILLRYILVAAVLAQYKCSDQENLEESVRGHEVDGFNSQRWSCSCSQAHPRTHRRGHPEWLQCLYNFAKAPFRRYWATRREYLDALLPVPVAVEQ